jgi:hypothetical protein
MSVDDEKLIAFADGELSGDERAQVEAALAGDAALREKLAAHQRLRAQLSAAFDGALNEPVPQRLLNAGEKPKADVIDFAARRAAKWSAREWGAMAASLAAGLVIAFGVGAFRQPPFAIIDGALVARGELARGLDTRLAAETDGDVRIGLTFRNQEGAYCRTFSLDDTAGLACNNDGAWRVAMTAAQAQSGEVRTASSDTPAEILAAVDAMIEGDVFDAATEASVRDRGWREH